VIFQINLNVIVSLETDISHFTPANKVSQLLRLQKAPSVIYYASGYNEEGKVTK